MFTTCRFTLCSYLFGCRVSANFTRFKQWLNGQKILPEAKKNLGQFRSNTHETPTAHNKCSTLCRPVQLSKFYSNNCNKLILVLQRLFSFFLLFEYKYSASKTLITRSVQVERHRLPFC